MDAIRRGAMLAMGKRAVGAIGAASLLGNKSPNLQTNSGQGSLQTLARDTAYGSDEKCVQSSYPPQPDPLYDARRKATRPLREKLDELRGYSSSQITLAMCMPYAEQLPDLAALKSTSVHWRANVAQGRAKKLRTAIQSIESEIEKIMSSPIDAVQDMLREAASAFLAEVQKP